MLFCLKIGVVINCECFFLIVTKFKKYVVGYVINMHDD